MRASLSRPGFQRGNRYARAAAKRKIDNPVEAMDRMARETLRRLVQREYEIVEELNESGHPCRRQKLKQLDAARANATANLLRLRLDIYAQHKAGEELRRLQEEVARLAALLPRGPVDVPRR